MDCNNLNAVHVRNGELDSEDANYYNLKQYNLMALFQLSKVLGSYIAPRSPFPEAIVDLPISTSDGSLSGRRTSLPRTAKGKEVVVERR
jgi:hypothetical protein